MEMLRFLCLLIVSAAFANRATYDNYQVHRVVPENQEQLNILKDLEDNPNGVGMLCQEHQESCQRKDILKHKILHLA
jgi:hypothetical protein